MNTSRRLLLPVALLTAIAAIAVPVALPKERGSGKAAGSPTKATGTPAVPATSPAHLRLWKTDLPDVSKIRLTWDQAGNVPVNPGRKAPASPEVARAGQGYVFGEYANVPAGHGTLTADAGGHTLASVPADLAHGSFHTLLVTARGAELISDDPTADAGTGDFTVRVLAPGVRVQSVRVGEELTAHFAAPGGLLRLRGLKAAVLSIRTEGTDAAGKPFDWTSEANFVRTPRQTLLVYPDAYGRIRPRLCVDGPGEGKMTNDE